MIGRVDIGKYYVGFVKYYNTKKKYGFIKSYAMGDVFFHISNTNLSSLNIGDIVGFCLKPHSKSKKKREAIDVKLAKYYTNELLSEKGRHCIYEWAMVMKGNEELFQKSFDYDLTRKLELFKNFNQYIENINVKNLIERYHLTVSAFGRSKPGGDDVAWVSIDSCWLQEKPEEKVFKYLPSDVYMQNLLPTIHESRIIDRGYVSWRRMVEEYKMDEENWRRLEEEALRRETEIKLNAKKVYNKSEHIRILYQHLEDETSKRILMYKKRLDKWLDDWNYYEIVSDNDK